MYYIEYFFQYRCLNYGVEESSCYLSDNVGAITCSNVLLTLFHPKHELYHQNALPRFINNPTATISVIPHSQYTHIVKHINPLEIWIQLQYTLAIDDPYLDHRETVVDPGGGSLGQALRGKENRDERQGTIMI